jgi:hypothetical protein
VCRQQVRATIAEDDAMIALYAAAADRRGRIFFRDAPDMAFLKSAHLQFEAGYFDDEQDLERDAAIQALIASSPIVTAVTHRDLQYPDDVVHVFLRHPDEKGRAAKLFACVAASPRHVREVMLAESPVVYEGFSLQLAPVDMLTSGAIEVGVEAWIERNYPALKLPRIVLDPWHGDAHYAAAEVTNLLAWLAEIAKSAPPRNDSPGVAQVDPVPNVADDDASESVA